MLLDQQPFFDRRSPRGYAACRLHGEIVDHDYHHNHDAQRGASPGAASKTIGVSIQNREAQFYQDMENGMKTEAAKYGYTLIIVDANRDNSKQQSQVEDFISKKVDAIVLTPYDSQAIGSAIAEANKANIPVFTADIAKRSKQGKVVAHIASDNVQGGMQAGKLMCQGSLGRKNRVGSDRHHRRARSHERARSRQGFQSRARKRTVRPSPSSPTSMPAAIVKRPASTMGDILQSHKDLKGIFGINDDSALGALTAVKAAGLKGLIIVGYDATPEAQAAIKAGDMYGDAIQYPDQIGAKTIDAIHD